MGRTEYLYMLHDLEELRDEDWNLELAGILESFDRYPTNGKEHISALRAFASRLAFKVQGDRQYRQEHSEAVSEALRERVEDD